MTASALAKSFGPRLRIELLESDEIGTIGVGEATIPTIHWFNQLVGLDEAEFLRATMASYKLGIEFVDWTRPGGRYIHPFGYYGITLPGVSFFPRWLKARREGRAAELARYSMAGELARAGRVAFPVDDQKSILSTLGYAYHFDAGLYGRHLRTIAEANGAVRHEGKLAQVERDPESGFVTALTTERGERFDGDLFIDCSGFRALLIEGALGAGFEDWSHWLPCDRAVAVPCEKVDGITPFTRSTARAAGWQWRIPLQHRTGNGYVYSSNYISDVDAARVLLENLDGVALADPRIIRFKAGRRRKCWDRNVVAIGLSTGFLEPLESTSLHLIQSGIAKLLSLFPDRDCDPGLAAQFNRLFAADMDNIKDFIILHYHAAPEKKDPLWEYCRHMPIPENLSQRIEDFRRSGRLMLGTDDLFKETSWVAVLHGQGIEAGSYHPLTDTLDSDLNAAQLAQIEQVIARSVPTLPLHEDALKAMLAGGAARR
ncbi:MAG: tryptophan halogenase [Alphaproteobacteria bacterium RIFCSPHIGHO2_12_FULL_63_12]|nr:MAG: tryptophan halogenase [Alphaproteobacteria bacterium RIFCSPHIGHO2_12_FULL_63_12]